MNEMRIDVEEGEKSESKRERTSFISLLCKLQRFMLIFGGVVFVIWFSVTYGSQNYENSTGTVVAMKLTASKCCEKEDIENIVQSGMLPNHVIPHHYNITLQMFMPPESNFTSEGTVNILIECVKPTKMIVLHARDLTIKSANITLIEFGAEDHMSHDTNISTIPDKQLVFIRFNEALLKTKRYVLDISFNGTINDQAVGLYRSSFKDKDSNISWIASTQLQPSDARRVFPCFDEPGLKSTFQLHIIRKKDTVTLSNMPDIRTETLNNYWEIVSFDVTPPMSTYLVAMVVGDIKPYSEDRQRGVQIWSRSTMAEYGEYAYHITADILEFLSEYLDVPYTMPKTDLVAVPSFSHAAMENWGLILFDEAALLYDPERSTTESKVFVTIVVAHELAHQWFGNLVTPTWWDHLWLNEGFATYYEYFALDALNPDWNITDLFISAVFDVMETDSLISTRAMGAAVSPYEVLEYFDEISYLKGSAIVRMVQHFLGEKNFQKGLKNYLHKYSYKNAKENDLWQNLNLWNRNNLGVKQIMKTWTDQPGYPVVKFERDYSNRSAKVTQKIFKIEAEEPPSLEDGISLTTELHKDKRTWIIPVTFTNGEEFDWSTKTDFWLKSRSDVLHDIPDETVWLIANIQQVGYYRVNYDIQNWEMLLLQLLDDHTVIHAINRAQLLNDALNLARADDVDYTIALNMTKYLYHEEEYLPWKSAIEAFRYVDLMLSKTSAHKQWKEYVLTLMSPLYQSLGWTNATTEEKLSVKLLRKEILKWSCNYGREDCVNRSINLFEKWRNDSSSDIEIARDDREIVLCTGISKGTIDDWEMMWKRYVRETFKGEKNILLKSLACTREVELLKKLLERAMNSSSGIPLEDGSNVFVYVAENFYGRDVVYNFFKNNVEEISFRFGSFPFSGSNIIDKVTAPLIRENEILELENFLRRRKTESGAIHTHLQMAIQNAKNNLHWIKHQYERVDSWLRENPIE